MEINNQIYLIAEMACAHDGEFAKVKKIIDASVQAKADAIQLQFFSSDHVVTPNHEVFPILKKIEFQVPQWKELFQYAKTQAIDVWVCAYDLPSLDLAIELKADGIKVNSSDLSNPDLLQKLAQSGIKFTLGTGASTMEEIANALHLIDQNGDLAQVTLMHGVQNFPTAIENLNISRIKLLQNTFGLPVGYADHTDASSDFSKYVDLIAVGMDIALIEKHITLDRSEKGIDYQAALEPQEWIHFVERIRLAEQALGSKFIKTLSESDLKYRKFQKKSMVAAEDLKSGATLQKEHLLFIRNAEPGMPPSDLEQVLGKTLKTDLQKFENISLKHLEL